jgi:hypothetical protein
MQHQWLTADLKMDGRASGVGRTRMVVEWRNGRCMSGGADHVT